MSQTSSSTRNTALWTKNSDGTYTGTSLALGWGGIAGIGANGTETHVGGVVAYDAQGDGYLTSHLPAPTTVHTSRSPTTRGR